jgi:hypothetical protein
MLFLSIPILTFSTFKTNKMKKRTFSLRHVVLFGFLGLSFWACTKSPVATNDDVATSSGMAAAVSPGSVTAKVITLTNPGFENDKTGWGDQFAISTSDVHSGAKSGKLSASGDKLQQSVTVLANTDYTLAAWIFGKGSIGAKSGSTVLNSSGGTFSAWTKVTVNFNSGAATGITLYGAYNAGEGRFDDFTLDEGSVTPPAVPAAPSALSATASGSSVINISWSDNSSTETGFKVERKTGTSGTWAEVAGALAANTTAYSSTGLAAATQYYFRVRAYNAAGNSAYSNEASATTGSSGGTVYPATILNLTNWKLTVPVNTSHAGNPDEYEQPELATYSDATYFHVNSGSDGVIFNANAGGATTGGSGYPRSELREMKNNGADEASWSSSSGTHTMEIDQAVIHLPVVKPHIVIGQIHDANDDVIVFRLEGAKLFMDHNGTDGTVLTNNYVLGTRFTVKFVVSGNQVKSYYNGVLKETYNKTFSGAYFKAGAYVQSSCTSVAGESCSAYGEVVIYGVTVTHQ